MMRCSLVFTWIRTRDYRTLATSRSALTTVLPPLVILVASVAASTTTGSRIPTPSLFAVVLAVTQPTGTGNPSQQVGDEPSSAAIGTVVAAPTASATVAAVVVDVISDRFKPHQFDSASPTQRELIVDVEMTTPTTMESGLTCRPVAAVMTMSFAARIVPVHRGRQIGTRVALGDPYLSVAVARGIPLGNRRRGRQRQAVIGGERGGGKAGRGEARVRRTGGRRRRRRQRRRRRVIGHPPDCGSRGWRRPAGFNATSMMMKARWIVTSPRPVSHKNNICFAECRLSPVVEQIQQNSL